MISARILVLACLLGSLCVEIRAFSRSTTPRCSPRHRPSLRAVGEQKDPETLAMEEEARLNVLQARREQIRGTLRAAESTRNFRLENGLVPELDEDGKPIKSDSKAALTFSAFVIAAGAIALRVGGRAALVSAMGLDFANENPQLKDNLDSVLSYAGSLDPLVEGALFLAAWTAVKLLCFDAGGVVLALASGILFGGVFQGAVLSALCATIGSSIAFGLAKLETPVRQKALEIVDEYPSLRGIEKVVARDGFKAILTLRLAPVLPIPLGMYNYVYGVTAVPFLDFFAGIFIGSLKPYLLDSYLGYFGKTIVDGSAASDPTNIQDIILLVVLGVSVLIGVFASQLAGETWDTVLEEVEEEKKAKADKEGEPSNDGIIREFLGFKLPQWVVGFQISMAMADDRVHQFIYEEFDAKVWNYTKSDGGPPADLDPAKRPDSPENVGINKGFDFVASLCDGLVLSPALFSSYLRYADPLFDEEKDKEMRSKPRDFLESSGAAAATLAPVSAEPTEEVLLAKLDELRSITKERLERLEALLTAEVDKEKEELWSRTKERLNNLDALLPPEKPNKNRL